MARLDTNQALLIAAVMGDAMVKHTSCGFVTSILVNLLTAQTPMLAFNHARQCGISRNVVSPIAAAIMLQEVKVMEEYTFQSATGEYVTVKAENEWRARSLAMRKLYGDIQFQPEWLGNDWVGFGLMLKGEA